MLVKVCSLSYSAPTVLLLQTCSLPLWYLLYGLCSPSRGSKFELRLWWLHVELFAFSTGKIILLCRAQSIPQGEAAKIGPLVWIMWGVLCSQQRHPLSVTPSPSSRMEMKISLSCHVRQEHGLWGHITTRYTSLTSASPSTSSHLEPVTWTMQQIDLLLSYHSSTIFMSRKKPLMLNILATFKKIAAEFHSHWVSFEQAVITYFLEIYFLEIIRDEVLMKYIWSAECGWRIKLMLEKAIIDRELVKFLHGKAQACILNIDHEVSR